jgi:hypothetical protein
MAPIKTVLQKSRKIPETCSSTSQITENSRRKHFSINLEQGYAVDRVAGHGDVQREGEEWDRGTDQSREKNQQRKLLTKSSPILLCPPNNKFGRTKC